MQQAAHQSEVASLSSKKEEMLLDEMKQTQKIFHYVIFSELSMSINSGSVWMKDENTLMKFFQLFSKITTRKELDGKWLVLSGVQWDFFAYS